MTAIVARADLDRCALDTTIVRIVDAPGAAPLEPQARAQIMQWRDEL